MTLILERKIYMLFSLVYLIFLFNLSSGYVFSKNVEETIVENYGLWQKVCNDQKINCVGSQFALNSNGEKIGRIIISKAEKNKNDITSVMNIYFPFETSIINLRSGLLITIDELEPLKEKFFYCDKKGCNARIQFSKIGNDALIKGSNLTIKFLDINKNNTIQILDVSLVDYNILFKNLDN